MPSDAAEGPQRNTSRRVTRVTELERVGVLARERKRSIRHGPRKRDERVVGDEWNEEPFRAPNVRFRKERADAPSLLVVARSVLLPQRMVRRRADVGT